ncbi:MAG TPA: hypothetical protein VHP38_15775 [Ruminiclostridium sp.]|nr:hypothetical protein [Ruminiclostridium sp.]
MALRKNKTEEKVNNTEIPTFSKEQIISCKRYSDRRDIVNVLLEADKLYSFDEVDNLINKFMKGKVK